MPSKFDLYGWYAGEGEGARTTPLAPANTSQTTTPGALRANFTGHVWVDLPYVVPVLPDLVEPMRSALWEQIKAIRDRKAQTGGYTTGGKWFHSDTFSRTQQMGLVMMGAGVPPVEWKTMDGSFITMTPTLAGQIFGAAASQDMALFGHAETLRAAVDAAADPSAIDINAGWPATYP